MSVVLVCFPGAPKVSEEAVKKEEELDKYLEARVEGEHTVAPWWTVDTCVFASSLCPH